MSETEELKAFSELKGNTLQVYLYLVKNQAPTGPREIQRKLDFSSPTLAAYHLEKLESLGLIRKEQNGYVLAKEVKVGALSQIVKFGALILPRYIFYLVFFSALLGCYFVFLATTNTFVLDNNSGFAILLGASIILVMTYECLRIWKQKLV